MKMAGAATQNKDEYWLVRLLCFALFSTAGMASISLAILAAPTADYYADQKLLQFQQKRFEKLQIIYNDREELLGNINYPGVIERAAVNQLHYQPVQAAYADSQPLPKVWPELESALAGVDQTATIQKHPLLQSTAEALAEKPSSRFLLFAFGSGLVLLSLTCFNRSNNQYD